MPHEPTHVGPPSPIFGTREREQEFGKPEERQRVPGVPTAAEEALEPNPFVQPDFVGRARVALHLKGVNDQVLDMLSKLGRAPQPLPPTALAKLPEMVPGLTGLNLSAARRALDEGNIAGATNQLANLQELLRRPDAVERLGQEGWLKALSEASALGTELGERLRRPGVLEGLLGPSAP